MASSGGGYAQAYPEYLPDARQRGRVNIAHVLPAGRDKNAKGTASDGIPADLLFTTILSKSLLALSLHLVTEWLFVPGHAQGSQIAQVNLRLLFLAAPMLAVWYRPWQSFGQRISLSLLALYGALLCAESFVFLTAATRLPILRVIMLTQSSELWTHGLQSMQKKAGATARNANFIAVVTLGVCYIAELYLNRQVSKQMVNSGYLAIMFYIFISATRQELLPTISSSKESEGLSRLHALGLVLSIPFAVLLTLLLDSSTSHSISSHPSSLVLATIGLMALAVYLVDPILKASTATRMPVIKGFKMEWAVSLVTDIFIGITAFGPIPHVADFVIAGISYAGITHILYADARLMAGSGSAHTYRGSGKHDNSTALETIHRQYRNVRATVKAILANPDSKKIYYFLCLNLAYMFIQMMYGLWTNSLGLISDSIHMFFDCLALAMGLFASVMSTWPRNETFTFGYTRVETLSGFANGIFLVLISIFIVFEAIQRLIDPPDMNTNQLLAVSMVGLGVNLVGMFATGHHHHGHSHGGHDHGGSCGGDHGHSHGHSHNMHGVFLHVMADTLGSVGVIISTLLINRYGWTGFDPIASIFIAVLIFASVIPLIMDSASLLCLDLGESREREVRGALAKLTSIEGVSSHSAARFWPKDPSTVVGSIHIQLAPSPSSDPSRGGHSHGSQSASGHYANVEKVIKRVEDVLKGAIDGLVDLSIQIESTEGSEGCPCIVSI